MRFARLLRERGVPVAPEQTARWIRSLELLKARRPQDLYWSGRVNLLSAPGQMETYDALFRAFWITLEHPALEAVEAYEVRRTPRGERREAALRADELHGERGRERDATVGPGRGLPGMEAWLRVQPAEESGAADTARAGDEERDAARGLYSSLELLRERDFAALSRADAAALRALLRGTPWWLPTVPSRRSRTGRRGERLDLRATLALIARSAGEPVALRYRRRVAIWRKWVFLCDISASMAPYTEAYLECLQTVVARRPRTEVFVFGTRLTRVTPHLRRARTPEAGAELAGVRDWHGGTRLGESLERFLRLYGNRGMAHGAVIFVLSDGLDEGEAGHVDVAMRRLRSLARRIVWINPLKQSPRYEPLARGMAEALPYLDDFASGHNLATLAEALRQADVTPALGRDRDGPQRQGSPGSRPRARWG